MIYFHAFGNRTVPAKLDRSFFVGLSKEQAWVCKVIFCMRYVDDCSFVARPSQVCSERGGGL